MKNPKTELCYHAPAAQGAGGKMPVTRKVEFLYDASLKSGSSETGPG